MIYDNGLSEHFPYEKIDKHCCSYQGSGFPVARGQPKGRRASQSPIMAGPVGQP